MKVTGSLAYQWLVRTLAAFSSLEMQIITLIDSLLLSVRPTDVQTALEVCINV